MKQKTQLIRCKNSKEHFVLVSAEEAKKLNIESKGDKPAKRTVSGNVLCFFERGNIYIKCADRNCKRWTCISFEFPGINIDFTQAAVSQKLMPRNYYFDADNAITIVEKPNG